MREPWERAQIDIDAMPLRVAVFLATFGAARLVAQAGGTPVLRLRDGGREIALSVADLKTLPRHQVRIAAENSSDSATVTGVKLWDVLQKAGIPSPEASGRQRAATYVRVVASDGQTAIFALVELDPGFSRKTVLLADQRDGKPLDSAEGPWRIFVPDDQRHARWVRGLARIDIGTLPP